MFIYTYIDKDIDVDMDLELDTVDSNNLEHGCRMINDGFPSFVGLELEDGRVPTVRLLLYCIPNQRRMTDAHVFVGPLRIFRSAPAIRWLPALSGEIDTFCVPCV